MRITRRRVLRASAAAVASGAAVGLYTWLVAYELRMLELVATTST